MISIKTNAVLACNCLSHLAVHYFHKSRSKELKRMLKVLYLNKPRWSNFSSTVTPCNNKSKILCRCSVMRWCNELTLTRANVQLKTRVYN